MKTFIIDFGPKCNGGRFALVQSETMEGAFWAADEIGSPFKIAQLIIPKREGIRYIEIEQPGIPFAGGKLSTSFKWIDNPFEKAVEALQRSEA